MITYVLSQFTHRSARAMGVIGGVALGAALFVALSALGNGFQQAARAPLANVAADLLITRPPVGKTAPIQQTRGLRLPFGSTPLTAAELAVITTSDGVTEAAGALELWDFGASQYQIVLGVEAPTAGEKTVGPGKALRDGLVAGRAFLTGEKSVVVADRHYAAFFSLKPGDEVSIGGQPFQVVGVVEQQDSSQAGSANFYIPLSEAQRLMGQTLDAGQVNQVYVRLADAGQVETVVGNLTTQLGPLSAISQESILQVMGGVAQVSARFAKIAGLVGLMGGWVLAWAAMAGLIAERQREIGVMKAVGWRSKDVIYTFLLEAFLLGLAGGLLGVLLGMGAAWVIGYLPAPAVPLSETLPGLTVAVPVTKNAPLSTQISPAVWLSAMFVAMGGALLAGWGNVKRAAALKPSQALRGNEMG